MSSCRTTCTQAKSQRSRPTYHRRSTAGGSNHDGKGAAEVSVVSEPLHAGNVHGALRRRPFSRWNETVVKGLLAACATVSLVTTFAIIFVLAEETIAFFREVSLSDFFLETRWRPLAGRPSFGIWELVAGTVNVVIWSLVIAVPIGLASAIYLSEYAQKRTRNTLKPMLEALAGVPTVVYAYFALNFVTLDILRPVLGNDVPIFNAFAASVMLAVMILPTIASISEDAMSSVPRDLREAAYGLGATKLEVATPVVLPAALSGVAAAVLLAI